MTLAADMVRLKEESEALRSARVADREQRRAEVARLREDAAAMLDAYQEQRHTRAEQLRDSLSQAREDREWAMDQWMAQADNERARRAEEAVARSARVHDLTVSTRQTLNDMQRQRHASAEARQHQRAASVRRLTGDSRDALTAFDARRQSDAQHARLERQADHEARRSHVATFLQEARAHRQDEAARLRERTRQAVADSTDWVRRDLQASRLSRGAPSFSTRPPMQRSARSTSRITQDQPRRAAAGASSLPSKPRESEALVRELLMRSNDSESGVVTAVSQAKSR
ncbi:MAG: hypothetical protein AAFX99_04590 [Myxococcota bacterium]